MGAFVQQKFLCIRLCRLENTGANSIGQRYTLFKVVRNSQIGGTWGTEEREGPFPFKKNIGFDLVIYNEAYSIQVIVLFVGIKFSVIFSGGYKLPMVLHKTTIFFRSKICLLCLL